MKYESYLKFYTNIVHFLKRMIELEFSGQKIITFITEYYLYNFYTDHYPVDTQETKVFRD